MFKGCFAKKDELDEQALAEHKEHFDSQLSDCRLHIFLWRETKSKERLFNRLELEAEHNGNKNMELYSLTLEKLTGEKKIEDHDYKELEQKRDSEFKDDLSSKEELLTEERLKYWMKQEIRNLNRK